MHGINDGNDVVQSEAPSMSLLEGSSNFNIQNSDIKQIHGNFNQIQNIIRFGDDQFTQEQRNWISDIISTHVALPDTNDNLNRKFLTQFVINLPRAEAVFDDYQNKKKSGACFEGTRVALLREMADWVTDLDGSKIYVLSGLAGIGKSTVAFTIASRAAKLNLLGASFFFSRDEQDRNNAKKLFTTIAYQLCVYNEAFAKAIGDALQTERGSAATTKDIQVQLQVLILDPLRNIIQSRTRPILVVVDALDECDEDDEYAVITGLSQLVRDLPSFKVILTTRPKPYIDRFLHNQRGHKLFRLQDIEDKIVDGDIRLYLKHSLSLEQIQKRCFRGQWCANDEEIDTLVHAAGRLFIIASTAVRYILDKFAFNPAAQMKKLLRAFSQYHIPFKDLDQFYTVILRNVVPANCDDDDIVTRYQSVVGGIVFIQRPLPVSALSHLIHISEEEIRAVLDHLQSVILLGNDDVPRIYHKSFPDYLTDQARCKDARLRIDSTASHTLIATCCFQITNKHLKYNILGLNKMARYMSNENALKEDGMTDERIQKKIPQQLHYACVHWTNHFQFARIENTDLMIGLSKFVNEHTLHWVEVLSLIGNLDSAHRTLRLVLKHLDSTSSDLQQLLSDALRFVLKFYEIIEQSALHTYYSALPFSPTDSLLYRQFIKEVEDNMFVIEGGPKKWDALVASPDHGQNCITIKFSHDSAMFYSCSERDEAYGKLKIWDAATGTPISTILGQKFAISNDFSTIASSKANTITCYNTNGSERGVILTAPSTIRALAISSDSGRVAAVLFDGSISLWEAKNPELIGIYYEYNGSEDVQLHFSSTGTRLVYSSYDYSFIKLRDGMSGRFIADLWCGSVHTFVLSGDGSRIASRSSDRGLILWSSESGARISGNKNECWENLAISENGSLLANSDQDTVTLWSEDRGHLVQIAVLEFECAETMVFSLDNILGIGSVIDVKLYDLKTHSLISIFPSNDDYPALAFSPDCTRFAYGAQSQMFLWDIQGIDTSSPPSNTAVVAAITLSRDCSRLACGYEDGRIELWGTCPAMERIASHQAHRPFMVYLFIVFRPDGKLFASFERGSDGTIKLWDGGDGSLHGTLQVPYTNLRAGALSNSLLVTTGKQYNNYLVLVWSLDTLSLIHTFQMPNGCHTGCVSISDDSGLVATCGYHGYGTFLLFDVEDRTTTTVTLFDSLSRSEVIRGLTFLLDKSHIVVWLNTGAILSFNLIDNRITKGPIFGHLIQLPNTPLWHGVPILSEWYYFSALFSQHDTPVPVLWIPGSLHPRRYALGSYMVAIACKDGRIVILKLPSSHKDDRVSRQAMHYPSCAEKRHGGATSNPSSAGNALHSRNEQPEVSGSQPAAKNTLNQMSNLADKEPKEEQVKHVGRSMRKRVKTAHIPLTDRVVRRSKK